VNGKILVTLLITFKQLFYILECSEVPLISKLQNKEHSYHVTQLGPVHCKWHKHTPN